MERTIYTPRPFSRFPRSYRSLTYVESRPLNGYGSLNALNTGELDDELASLASSTRSELVTSAAGGFFSGRGPPSGSTLLDRASRHPVHSPTGGPSSPRTFDQFSVDSQLSSRAQSPQNMSRHPPTSGRVYFPGDSFRQGIASPDRYHSNSYDYDPPGSPLATREEDFLQRLKQQRLQAESLVAPYQSASYHESVPNRPIQIQRAFPANQSYHEDFDPWEYKANEIHSPIPSQLDDGSTLERAYNRALHKTRSDSYVFQDLGNSVNFGRHPARANIQNQSARHFPSANDNYFGQSQVQQPVQARTVPIRISVPENNNNYGNNQAQALISPVHQNFHNDFAHQQFRQEPSYHHENRMFHSTPQLNFTPNRQFERNAFSPPPIGSRYNDYHRQEWVRSPEPVNLPPPIPPPPVNYIGPQVPIHHAQNQPDRTNGYSEMVSFPASNDQSPTIRHPPVIARNLQPVLPADFQRVYNLPAPPEDPLPQQVEGPQRNRAVPLGTVTELGYYNNKSGQQPPALNSSLNRSFAIVSRPFSPQATIVQPVQPIQPVLEKPIVHNSIVKLSPSISNAYYESAQIPNEIPRREAAPPMPKALSSPTEERIRSPAQMSASPIGSVYDNQEAEMRARNLARQHYRSPSPPWKQGRAPRPHSILVKGNKLEGNKASKKVVFDVDDSDEESIRQNQLKQADAELAIYHSDGTNGYRGDSGSAGSDSGEPKHVQDYDEAISENLHKFVTVSSVIGGDLAAVANAYKGLFDRQREFLFFAARNKELDAAGIDKSIPMQKLIQAVQEIHGLKDKNRNNDLVNHFNALAEASAAVGWVKEKPKPAPLVKEILEAAKFYTNRIRLAYKKTNENHIEWVNALEGLMTNLNEFIRKVHTTGLVWNSAPGPYTPPASTAPTASASAHPPVPGGPPPPPPPPMPTDLFAPAASTGDAERTKRDALFAALNQGEGITSSLRKVTSDMQTHKNPELRATSTVPAKNAPPPVPGGPAARPAPAVQKPPKMELQDGKQWNVEYYKGTSEPVVVNVTDKKQTVYVFKCENATIKVAGKCNSVTLDQCKKVAIVFDAIVAQVETINCQSLQIQTMGEMPTVSVQKTDGCQIYLSEASKGAEIVTSKSSEMNVLVPGPDGDFIELPVPEQFKTVFQNGKLVTTVSDIC